MKRFREFQGGPQDGALEYCETTGLLPAHIPGPTPTGPVTRTAPDDPTAPSVTGTYLLASMRQHHGAWVAVYRWKRQTGDRPTHRAALTTADLQRLTKTLSDHPDLRRPPCP
jgi:hypothetical protein